MYPMVMTVEVLRNDDDPDQVMTVGYMDVSADELEALRDQPETLAGEAARLQRIAPYEDAVLVNGIFALVEDVRPD